MERELMPKIMPSLDNSTEMKTKLEKKHEKVVTKISKVIFAIGKRTIPSLISLTITIDQMEKKMQKSRFFNYILELQAEELLLELSKYKGSLSKNLIILHGISPKWLMSNFPTIFNVISIISKKTIRTSFYREKFEQKIGPLSPVLAASQLFYHPQILKLSRVIFLNYEYKNEDYDLAKKHNFVLLFRQIFNLYYISANPLKDLIFAIYQSNLEYIYPINDYHRYLLEKIKIRIDSGKWGLVSLKPDKKNIFLSIKEYFKKIQEEKINFKKCEEIKNFCLNILESIKIPLENRRIPFLNEEYQYSLSYMATQAGSSWDTFSTKYGKIFHDFKSDIEILFWLLKIDKMEEINPNEILDALNTFFFKYPKKRNSFFKTEKPIQINIDNHSFSKSFNYLSLYRFIKDNFDLKFSPKKILEHIDNSKASTPKN